MTNSITSHSDAVRFNRPPRIQKTLPDKEIVLPAPPVPANPPSRNIFVMLLPSMGMLFSMGLMSWFTASQSGNWAVLVPTATMAIVSVLTTVFMYREQAQSFRKTQAEQEKRFQTILELKLSDLKTGREEESKIRIDKDPPLDELRKRIESDDLRLWERRPVDLDFASVRLGVGELTPSIKLKLPEMDPLAPHYEEVQNHYTANKSIKDVPVPIGLREVGSIGIWGQDRSVILETLYAALTHLTAHHAPHELRIALACDSNQATDWDWLKWVRHNESLQPDLPGHSVAIGPEASRILLADLVTLIRPRLAENQPSTTDEAAPVFPVHYLLIIDRYNLVKDDASADYLLRNARRSGLTIIDIESSARDVPDICESRLELLFPTGKAEFAATGADPIIYRFTPDRLTALEADELARMLTSKHQARSTTTITNIPTSVRLVDALFSKDMSTRISVDEIKVAQEWRQRPPDKDWSILLGLKQGKEPVWLNLLEDRDGPHGLVAGTTGSGKSVLLQSMILSLALTHAPSEINFVLIDFKGGSTVEPFRNLPHTVSVITNLQGRLVDRALVILKAEAHRRQEVLQLAGFKDIATYRENQISKGLAPLPRLLIIIDEFAEMAKTMPTFMDEVNSLAAIGRSLGMHLILATQKPAGVVPDKVWANLKFRICLRVADAADSRDMLSIPDAALLPSNLPGRGYLRVGSERIELMQSANVIYPYRPAEAGVQNMPPRTIIVRKAALGESGVQTSSVNKMSRAIAGRTEMDVLVERIEESARPEPRWPDPLPPAVAIEHIWRQYTVPIAWQPSTNVERLLVYVSRNSLDRRLRLAIGLLDDPYQQKRRLFEIDLTEKNYLIVGAPRSGRSTLLQTIIRAILANTTPQEINLSLLDFGGQNLAVFQGYPHVANFFNVNTAAQLSRFIAQISEDLDQRTKLSATQRLDQIPQALYVIDGFAELKGLFQDEISVFGRVAREGLSLGVHLIITADQGSSVPLSIRSNLSGHLALRLNDASEYSDLVGRVSGALPDPLPGRGLVREGSDKPILEFQAALPISRWDEPSQTFVPLSEYDTVADLRRLGEEFDKSWTGSRPSPIEILPASIEARPQDSPHYLPEYLQPAGRTWGQDPTLFPSLVIGKDNRLLDWRTINYGIHGPHFLVCGPPQSGKTNLLRLWVWSLAERYSPAEIQVTVIGLRNRSLNILENLPQVRQVVHTEFRLDAVLADLETEASQRYQKLKEIAEEQPEADLGVMAKKLWPTRLVVVDDFDNIRYTRERQAKLLTFARYGLNTRTFLMVAGATSELQDFQELPNLLKRGRAGVMLQPGDMEARVMDVRLSTSALRQEFPIGRGYLLLGNKVELVQTIHLADEYLDQRGQLLQQVAKEQSLKNEGSAT